MDRLAFFSLLTIGSLAASATTVTIAPGNGNATNVSARITGSVDVETNPGASGGGIVTLGRFNDYTGTTSNGCGTLVATALAPKGMRSSIGSTGQLVLGAGTFRYTGTPGATLGHSVTNAFAGAEMNKAIVIDAVSDFGFDGQWVQPTGALIKKGAGTFTIHGAPNNATNFFGVTGTNRITGLTTTGTLTFPENGDAPAAGCYAGLTVAEGTLRVDGGVNVFGQRWGAQVGAQYDYGTATPTLELAGGTNIFYGAFYTGCTKSGGESVVRITGGENILACSGASDRKLVRVGVNSDTLGRLDMSGGSLTLADAGMNFTVSSANGSRSSINLSGGTITVNRYVILGYAASSSGTLSGDFVVSDSGYLDVSEGIETYNVNAKMDWNFIVRDGGTVRTKRFFHAGNWTTYPKPNCTLLIDGGIIHGRRSEHIFGNGAANGAISKDGVRIGSKGMILQTGNKYVLTNSVPLVATNTVAGMSPVGLTLRSTDSNSAHFLFTTNNSYAGPTRVQQNAFLELSTGDLPEGSEVICESGSRLYLANHPRTFKSLSMGKSCVFVPTVNATLTVTDSFKAEACTTYLKVAGDNWSANLTTPGTYTLLTVPVADADELRTFAKSFSFDSSVVYRSWVEMTATTAVLKVQFYGSEDPRVVDLGAGDVYDVAPYSFDLCRTAGNGLTLNLTTGAVLRAAHLQASSTNDASIQVFFDGGTFQPVFLDWHSYLRNVAELIVGAGGVTFDLSTSCDDPANANYYFNVKGTFKHDPNLGDLPDGGLAVTNGPVMLGGDFVCAFTGLVRVLEGGRLTASRDGDGLTVSRNCRVEVEPKATLEQFNGNAMRMADLTLGRSASTDPTFLTLRADSSVSGFAVTNALQVLSPVQVSTRLSDFPTVTRQDPTGELTVLVFASANATVDPGLFTLNAADHPAVSATFAIVDYANPDLPTCDKALVMTCTAKDYVVPTWTSTAAGGTWNTLGNWTHTDVVPNASSVQAQFDPATAAEVGVTLPTDGVALRTLTLDGEAGQGYALTGGTLSMTSYRLATPELTATSGTHKVARLQTSDKLLIKTATNDAPAISSVEIGALTGDGDVSVNTHVSLGAGTVKLGTAGFTGTLTTGSGVTEVDDLSFATTASRLKTGAATFRYTGPAVTFGGFQLNGSRATYFETATDLFALAPVATKGALVKAGAGKLTLGGTGTFKPTAGEGNKDSDRTLHTNGDMSAGDYYSLTVDGGTLAIGVKDDPNHAPTVIGGSSRSVALGTPHMASDARTACLQMNNGTLRGDNITMGFYLGSAPVANPPTLRFEQNGGTTTVTNYLRGGYNNTSKKTRYEVIVNGGELNVGNYVAFNVSNPSTANAVTNILMVNGGAVNVGTYFCGNNSSSSTRAAPTFVTLNGGTFTIAGDFDFTKSAANTTVLDLNAGAILAAGRVMRTAKGNSIFNFNGGTFQPLGTADGTTLTDLTALNVSTNGAVIDTSRVLNGTYTIAQALAHDARLGEVVDGGLLKKGTGTLVLSAANTFTGLTRVDAGVLKVTADGAIPAAVAVDYDGTLDLDGAARTIPALVRAPGVIENGTLSLAQGIKVEGACEDEGACPMIYADLTIPATATLDLGLADGAEGPSASTVIPLAYVAGSATVPGSVKAVHAGKVKRFDLSLQSGLLVAKPSSGGTVILFR